MSLCTVCRVSLPCLCEQPAPSPQPEMPDSKRREPGCECQLEEGDSPCVVHGLYEPEAELLPAPFTVRMVREQGWELVPPGSRAVLDDMAAVPPTLVQDWARYPSGWLNTIARHCTELARRAAKEGT